MAHFTSLAELVAPRHTAVIVVDVQNEYCEPQGFFGRQGVDVSPLRPFLQQLGRFLDQVRTAGVPVAFVQTIRGPEFASGPELFRRQQLGQQEWYLQAGSWGTQFTPPVLPQPQDLILTKHRYSVFATPGTAETLRARGIQTLVFTGLATNVCVESSLRDAFMRDFYVALVDDCCAAYTAAAHQAAVFNVRSYFGPVLQSTDLLSLWEVPAHQPGVRSG